MTIIAGFKTDEGVVLCADTQETVRNYMKRNVPKVIFHPKQVGWTKSNNLAVAFCGAGEGPFIDKLTNKAWRAAENAPDFETACAAIELAIENVYERFGKIYQQDHCPEADLLYGVKMDGKSKLFSAVGPIVNEVDHFETNGAGKPLADFIVSRIYSTRFSLSTAVILAAYTLFHTKEHADLCGGGSHIAVLRNDGNSGMIAERRIDGIERTLEWVDRILNRVVLQVANLQRTDAEVQKMMDYAVKDIKKQRRIQTKFNIRWDELVLESSGVDQALDDLGVHGEVMPRKQQG